MQQEADAVQDLDGNAVAGAAVTVIDKITGELAALFADNETTSISNPVYTDANGRYAYKAKNGKYRTSVSIGGRVFPGKADITLFDPADGGAADLDFVQAGTGATPRAIQDKLRETVSVKDFGAKGDGVTDDTAAIRAAVASSAGNILFPEGNYVVNDTLTITGAGKILMGMGQRRPSITFKDTFDGPALQYRPATVTDNVFRSQNGLANLTLAGSGSRRAGRWAADLIKQEGFILDNVQWSGFSYGVRVAGGQMNRLRRFTGQGSGLAAGTELPDSTHLRFEKAANVSGYQACYTVNLDDFFLSGSGSKNIRDIFDIRSVDGLNVSNGYVAYGTRSLLKLETDANNDVITAVTFTNVYFDGVSRASGTPNGLFIPAAAAGRITASFGDGCFFGNYTASCIDAGAATNIRSLKFNGVTLAGAEASIGQIKGVTGASGSRISFLGCDISAANGGLAIDGGRLLNIAGTTSFTDILGTSPFLSITGAFSQKIINYTHGGNAVPASDTSTALARPTNNLVTPGSFIPQLRIGGVLLDNAFHSTQLGQFDLIGDRCFFDLTLTITGKNGLTGSVEVSGLSFPRGGNVNASCLAIHSVGALAASVVVSGGDIVAGTSRIRMQKKTTTGDTLLTDADITSTYSVRISGSYPVA